MQHKFDYVIVGAGMAGQAAAKALRAADAQGTIALIGADPHPPYARPPLSKKLWKNGKEADIWFAIDKAGATLSLGRSATRIDRKAHVVHDDQGDAWQYRKLLLATGGTPRTLGGNDDFIYFRTFDDYQRLRQAVHPGARVTVIGGGFIGSELAAAMATNGCKVSMIFPDATIAARVYPAALAKSVTDYYREKGVDVRSGLTVAHGERTGGHARLTLSDGSMLDADVVVAGLGITPNVALAEEAGLEIDNGIVVNAHLQTSDADVYAAGDVASFPAVGLDRQLRVEHENAALTMGDRAGQCMAGKDAPYDELPFFYSDLFDLGYEAVGVLDSRLQTVEQWATPYRKGVVYYLDAGRVRGVLLWNTWDQVSAARKLIAESGPFNADTVRGRLPAAK
ncbi:MAG TPA: FAD-dependent oxidoreductase [Rhodanobacteraceae bacterium]|nr:FAD-dependent oxidoreductase [Rhodanobacteraceae bacterium]